MSEVAEQIEDITPQEETGSEPANNNQEPAKPAGYDPVDLDNLPPEVKNRIDYLYRQVKDGERERRSLYKTINDYKSVAEEQYNELAQVTTKLVNHVTEQTVADTEANLNRQMQEAFERGDTKAYLDVQRQLIDLGVKKALNQAQPKQQPQKPQNQNTQTLPNSDQILRDAQSEGDLNPEESRVIEAWMNERDESGQLIRPWAHNSNPNGRDERYLGAVSEMLAVWQNPLYASKTVEEKIAEVDRRLGVQKRQSNQNVLGGGLNTPRKANNMRLSPDAEKLAVRMKFAGPKATEAEHIEKYRQQLIKVRNKK